MGHLWMIHLLNMVISRSRTVNLPEDIRTMISLDSRQEYSKYGQSF